VQRLFDGQVSELVESAPFTASGVVRLTGGRPILELDPASP
jgi:hypothetical protein